MDETTRGVPVEAVLELYVRELTAANHRALVAEAHAKALSDRLAAALAKNQGGEQDGVVS